MNRSRAARCMGCSLHQREHVVQDERGWYAAVCDYCRDLPGFAYVMPYELLVKMRRELAATRENIAQHFSPQRNMEQADEAYQRKRAKAVSR